MGFALTTLQRRLASSPAAIYQSIVRRRKRLETRLEEEKLRRRAAEAPAGEIVLDPGQRGLDEEDLEDLPEDEVEEIVDLAYFDEASVVVRREVAQAQKRQAQPADAAPGKSGAPGRPASPGKPASVAPASAVEARPAAPKRFHGTVRLDPLKLGSSAGRVGDEVVQHLQALLGSAVEVTLEIRAAVGDGVPDSVVRTVSENARTLKFESFGFEEE